MWPTHDDAIRLYAHFWRSRHGREAAAKAKDTARAFARRADFEGEKAWNEVADEVGRLEDQQNC